MEVKQAGKLNNSVMAASRAAGKNAMPVLMRSNQKCVPTPTALPAFLQAKLQVNKPGDSYEQEANATADRVMRMPANVPAVISRLAASGSGVPIGRKCAHCMQEEPIQKKSSDRTINERAMDNGDKRLNAVEADLQSTKGSGQALPGTLNTQMSKAIGADFSNVRVHTDGKAVSMNRALNAFAFTHGRDIYFNAGMYNPDTTSGQHLLAHELTHVVQQGYAPALKGSTFAVEKSTGIQRLSMGDLEALNPLDVSIDDLIKKYMPELLGIKNAGGIVPWIETKVTSAVEAMLNAAVAPVKGAVDFVGSLSPALAKMINWIKTAGGKISKNDCSSFTELGDMVGQLVDELAAPAIEKIKDLSQKVSHWFSGVWEKFGLPVWDFIKRYVGGQYELIKSLGIKIWDKTEPIRAWASSVWIKFKNWLGIGDGPEGQNGIIQWVEAKLIALWDKIKAKVEPFKKQLLIAGGVLVMLSPAGPLIAAGAIVTGIITAANWIRKNIHSPADIARLRVKFEKEILPGIVQGLTSATASLKGVFGALAGKLASVVGVLGKLTALVADGILAFIQSALTWITAKFTEIADWATTHLSNLATWLQQVFDNVRVFATLIINFLAKVSAVANNIMSLPTLIIGGLWKKVPKCIRDGIQDFLINTILKNVPYFEDVKTYVKYWQKIKAGTMDVIRNVFVTGDLKAGILKAFKLLLDVLGIPVQLVVGIYNKALAAFDQIVNKPKVIFASIVTAIKDGFKQFQSNFFKNSIDALGNWVFSQVKGVKMPKDFTVQSVFGLVVDILGFTEDNVFKRIELKTSKPFAEKLRKVYQGLKTAAKWIIQVIKDPKAAYEQAKGKLGELKNKLFKSIGNWISKNVIAKFITKITAMLVSTPFGEAVEAIIDAYKMIKTAIEYAERILRVVDSALDSILDLAAGVTSKAAGTVEKGLTMGLEIAVAFIAKELGIGDLPQKVKAIVEEDIRPAVDTAIDSVIDTIVAVLKGIKEFTGDVKEAMSSAFNWASTKTPFADEAGESHTAYIENKQGGPVVMVASTPISVKELIKEYRAGNQDDSKKLAIADRVEQVSTHVEGLAFQISKLDASLATVTPENKAKIQNEISTALKHLLIMQTALTMLLSKMLRGQDYTQFKNRYAIEGLVGLHRFSPKSDNAKFEADHQPSKKFLSLAAGSPGAPELLKWAEKTDSALGFTIVLGDYRHQAGRTHSSKAKPLADQFSSALAKQFDKQPDPRKRKVILESALKTAAILDAEAMEAVVSESDLKKNQWRDIAALPLSFKEKQVLRGQIQVQVQNGERLIKATNISINTNE
jgi:hypothetical protein